MQRSLMRGSACWMQGHSCWMPMPGRARWMPVLDRARWMPVPGREPWMPGSACRAAWMPMQGRSCWMLGRAWAARAGCLFLAVDAGPRALDAGTIWQDMQGYIGVFLDRQWSAIATNNAGHSNTPAHGCTAADTTLCPICAAAATIFMKQQQCMPCSPGSGLGEHEIL